MNKQNKPKHECKQCQKTFLAYGKRKFCGQPCFKKFSRVVRDNKVFVDKRPEHTCEQCNVVFRGVGKRRFCSQDCCVNSRTQIIEKTCEFCEKKFILQRNNGKLQSKKTKFCSMECFGKSKETFVMIDCLNCKKEMRVFQSELELGRKYCSTECYNKYKTKQAVETKVCVICKNEFQALGSRPEKCCSTECGHKLAGQTHSGENHHMFGKTLSDEHRKILSEANKGRRPWNKIGDGITPKTKLERDRFKKTIHKEVLKRDDYTCQMCDERGGYLHVDHIQPWAEYVELRFEMKNLRTLCVDCHYLVTFGRKRPVGSTWGIVNNMKIQG